jgi:hypothetical protein
MLVVLADAVEQASRDGLPLAGLLDDLDEATDHACLRLPAGATRVEQEQIERWRSVVTSVRHDVESGRVRSVSGIAREARRLAMRLEQPTGIAVPI